MRSRVAFYSTICISATFDHVVRHVTNPGRIYTNHEVLQRHVVQGGIIQMINERLDEGDIDDGAIIAVVHVLYSELIHGEQTHIGVHFRGLHEMVKSRRSLHELGVDGLLAKIVVMYVSTKSMRARSFADDLASSMHLVGILSEQTPDVMYTAFAKNEQTDPSTIDGPYCECPIYAARGYTSISANGSNPDRMLHILDLTQQASNAFIVTHALSHELEISSAETPVQAKKTLQWARDRIAEVTEVSQPKTKATSAVEFVRLAARIHVEALYRSIPYSQATNCQKRRSFAQETGRRCDSVVETPEVETPLILQAMNALKDSDIDGTWEAQRGVLVWAGLVILAASSRMLYQDRSLVAELREECILARQFVSAVVLRAAIRQIFEHTVPMLGMLKRFVAFQQALGTTKDKLPFMSETVSIASLETALTAPDLVGIPFDPSWWDGDLYGGQIQPDHDQIYSLG